MGLTNTSGTGEIFTFYNDKSTAGYAIASRLLFESWMGLRLGDRMAWLFNGPFSRRRRIRRMLTGLFTIPMSWLEGDPGAAVRIIRSVRPSALMGDLSILSSVANNIIRGGVDARMGLRATAPTAEVLLPNHRNLIARAFNCSVFNRYGLAEATGYVAQECNAHQGLHVNGGLVVVEVVKDGEPCGPGETGSIVLTNLHNYAMPFIRYDTGDLATVGDGCSCGRAFPVLARIEGRSPQWVLTESVPVPLTGYLWTLQLTNFPISQCQFVQSKIGELTLLVAPKSALTTAQIAKLAKLLATVRPFVRVNVEAVDSIQPEASGKRVIFKPLRASA
jgi:phenylacetate-CoA ligase